MAARIGKFASDRQMTHFAHITHATYIRACKGYPFQSTTVDRLADALGVSPLDLISVVEADTVAAYTPPAILQAGPMLAAA